MLCILAAVPAVAPARFNIDSAGHDYPEIDVADASGIGHVVYRDPTGEVADYCQIPAGDETCDGRLALAPPAAADAQPRPYVDHRLSGGSGIVDVISPHTATGGGAADYDMFDHRSTDGGAAFVAPGLIGKDQTGCAGDNDPEGDAAFSDTSVAYVNRISGGCGIVFQSATLGATSPPATSVVLGAGSPSNGTVGLADGAPVVVYYNQNTMDLSFRGYDGTGDVNDVSNWFADQAIENVPINPFARLHGGPSGLVLVHQRRPAGSTEIAARRYNAATRTFAEPVTIHAGSTLCDLDVNQDASGRIHVAYCDGATGDLMHATSTDGGATWTPPALIDDESNSHFQVQLHAGENGAGWAVWRDNGIWGAPLPSGGFGGGLDADTPRRVRAGAPIPVEVGCSVACEIVARGRIRIPRRALRQARAATRGFRTTTARASLAAGKSKILKLRLNRRARRALRRAKSCKRGKAIVTVKATDAAGESTRKRATSKLRC